MTWAACYDLTLECDGPGDGKDCVAQGLNGRERMMASFNDEHGSACRKAARRAGWKFFKDGTCMCRECAKK